MPPPCICITSIPGTSPSARLGQYAYVPAISNDVSGGAGKKALAEEIDAKHHAGLPPYVAYAARTVFLHTLAFNEPLKGLPAEQLRYSAVGPALDLSFIEEARKKFIAESAYLDDRPGAPMRFLAEANLRQIIRREEQKVDPGDLRAQLNDRIREIFKGKTFEAVCFVGGPFDVPDEVGDGRPKLVVLGYDGVTVGGTVDAVPELVARIHARKGADGFALRAFRNHVVFVAAAEDRREEMRRRSAYRLALQALKKPERLVDLVDHQQDKVRELEARSEQELALAIQQCYRHVFYPSRHRLGTGEADLAHTAIDTHSASVTPGAGQQQIVRVLHELGELRLAEDEPVSPTYVRDRTPLRNGQMTTLALRNEFRRDPVLPMLIGDDVFVRGVRRGIEQGEYVYRRGDLLFGPGDPAASIEIDEQAVVFTMGYARDTGVWPRPQQDPPQQLQPDPEFVHPVEGTTSNVLAEPPTAPSTGPTSAPAPDQLSAEGLLREALALLWEKARARGIGDVGTLTIRLFEAGDAFRLMGAVASVSGAEKTVTIEGGYETREGGSFELEFRGPPADAQPVREFLEPQLRDAGSQTLQAGFELVFADGLSMQGDAAEKLTERLTQFASGAAYVSATAEAKA